MANNHDGTKMAPDFLNYNTLGLRPVKTTFNLDCDMVTQMIFDIASREIDGIIEVTHEHDIDNGIVQWYIWFDSGSDHFLDKSTRDTPLRESIRQPSQKFQEFAKKFGWCEADDDPVNGSHKVVLKHIVRTNQNKELRAKMTYLQVSINQFLRIAFDTKGAAYQKEYGIPTPKVTLDRKYKWESGSGHKFKTLLGVRVEKFLDNAFIDRKKPRANRSEKFV